MSQISTLPSQVADLCASACLYILSRISQALSLESSPHNLDKSAKDSSTTQNLNKSQIAIAFIHTKQSAPTHNKTTQTQNPSDSKILAKKCELQGRLQRSCLDSNNRRDFALLPYLLLKAKSLKAAYAA